MNHRSSVAHRSGRAGRDCHVLAEKVTERRAAENTHKRRKNSKRHERRTYKNAGEEGLCRLIAWRQEQRTPDIASPEATENKCAWISGNERRSKPRAGIQRSTPRIAHKNKVRPACNLDAIELSKSNHHKRMLMRQIKKVVAFAKRCGRDAEAIRIHLVERFLNSATAATIPVGKYQRRILEESRGATP